VTLTGGTSIVNGQVVGASPDFVQGSGRIKQESRTLAPFSSVHINLVADVTVSKGANPASTITADDNILPVITTQVSMGVLTISNSKSFASNTQVLVRITAPSLSRLVVDGAGDVSLSGVDEKTLELVTRGSGGLARQGPGGRPDGASGRCRRHGAVRAADALGGGAPGRLRHTLQVSASETFSGVIEGSGDILVRGHPRMVRSVVNGAGSIIPQ
jgi:Putative auto-transporter adhesin, head GIN domain